MTHVHVVRVKNTSTAVGGSFWNRLARFSFKLHQKGIDVPLVDLYIALLAIENNASLLHCDKHFDIISQNSALEIYRPL